MSEKHNQYTFDNSKNYEPRKCSYVYIEKAFFKNHDDDEIKKRWAPLWCFYEYFRENSGMRRFYKSLSRMSTELGHGFSKNQLLKYIKIFKKLGILIECGKYKHGNIEYEFKRLIEINIAIKAKYEVYKNNKPSHTVDRSTLCDGTITHCVTEPSHTVCSNSIKESRSKESSSRENVKNVNEEFIQTRGANDTATTTSFIYAEYYKLNKIKLRYSDLKDYQLIIRDYELNNEDVKMLFHAVADYHLSKHYAYFRDRAHRLYMKRKKEQMFGDNKKTMSIRSRIKTLKQEIFNIKENIESEKITTNCPNSIAIYNEMIQEKENEIDSIEKNYCTN